MTKIKNFSDYMDMINESIESDPKKYTIAVDIVADIKNGKLVTADGEGPAGYIENLIAGLDYDILEEVGSGGGWPHVEFTGTKAELLPLLKGLAADPDVDVEKELDAWDGSHKGLLEIIG
jgi:hypothetical protein